MLRRFSVAAAIVLVILIVAPSVHADYFFTAGDATHSATVNFSVKNNVLTVTLTNNSMVEALVPVDVLTGVFFDLPNDTSIYQNPGSPTITRVSANLNKDSVVTNASTCNPSDPSTPKSLCAGPGVGGEWAFKNAGGGNLPGVTQNSGISSSGLGIFGPPDMFPGPDLDQPVSPDGLQYGILPTPGYGAGANAPLKEHPLIKNSVVFQLSGFSSTFDPSRISNVKFQYGTSLSEGGGGSIPEPASMVLLGSGLAALVVRPRLRKQ